MVDTGGKRAASVRATQPRLCVSCPGKGHAHLPNKYFHRPTHGPEIRQPPDAGPVRIAVAWNVSSCMGVHETSSCMGRTPLSVSQIAERIVS
jgi:hypothetical protein